MKWKEKKEEQTNISKMRRKDESRDDNKLPEKENFLREEKKTLAEVIDKNLRWGWMMIENNSGYVN